MKVPFAEILTLNYPEEEMIVFTKTFEKFKLFPRRLKKQKTILKKDP